MMKKILLLLTIAGTTGLLAQYKCGICLCTPNANGCVETNCISRNISTLPVQVPNETCILILRDNEIESVKDFEFQCLADLIHLDLSQNRIGNMSKDGFKGLSNLRSLSLLGNDLNFATDKVDSDVFKPLSHLKYLDLKENSYAEYPDEHLSKFESLADLGLNGLQGRAFGLKFSHLKHLTSLNLAGTSVNKKCGLKALYNFTFENTITVRLLNLSHCNIIMIEPVTFLPLRNIDTLDLSYNENLLLKGMRDATYSLNNSMLRRLIINKIVPADAVCVIIEKSFVEHLQNSSLEILEAKDNRIEIINVDALESLPKSLKHISAGSSRFTVGPYLQNLHLLTNLISLDLSESHVIYSILPDYSGQKYDENDRHPEINKETCLRHPRISENELFRSHYRNTKSLFQLLLRTSQDNPFRVPPHLENFSYNFGQLFYDISDIYLAENSLKFIDLSFNMLIKWHGPVHSVENITHLDLSNNFADYLHYNFFENFKSLKFLNLSWNRLNMAFYHDFSGTLFRNQQKLEILDLSGNGINKLPYRFLEGLSSLRRLLLYSNSITTLDINYHNNIHLHLINCSDNEITFIPVNVRTTLDNLAERNNLSIDLSWNPFECTCDSDQLHFLEWIYNTKVGLTQHRLLMCIHYHVKYHRFSNMDLKYKELKETCKVYFGVAMGLLSVVILFTTAVLYGMVYRYRWKLIYIYYSWKRKISLYRKSKIGTDYMTIYDFDGFVSYADKDIDFLTKNMLPKLEYHHEMNLYVRDRDSLPGAVIAENIIDGIQRSKKSILLISKASLASKWCRYEVNMSNMEEVSTKRNVMIIVILEPVPSKDIPPEILYHVQNNATLQYPTEDEAGRDLFWASLVEALQS